MFKNKVWSRINLNFDWSFGLDFPLISLHIPYDFLENGASNLDFTWTPEN